MILTHGANSLKRGDGDFVEIGGRRYPVVKIGNQLWMAENLDYKWTGLTIGGSYDPYEENPHAWYYNNDEATYGIDGTYKCGLLYNWFAADYLEVNKATLLPDGWHVPTSIEFDTLATTVGGTSNAGKKLKALDDSVLSNWPSGWNGTDEYGFKVLPSGRYDDQGFALFNEYCLLWLSDSYSTTHAYSINISLSDNVIIGGNYKLSGRVLRLVKDVT